MVGHVLIYDPWHYLKKIAVERRRKAVAVGGTCTSRMEVIKILTGSHDRKKLLKRGAAFRQPGFIRSQVAGNNVWKRTFRWKGPEIISATQISRRIERLLPAKDWPEKVWVSRSGEFRRGASRMATGAVGLSVDNIAAQSHQISDFSGHIQLDRRYPEADLNLRFVVVVIIVVIVLSSQDAWTD